MYGNTQPTRKGTETRDRLNTRRTEKETSAAEHVVRQRAALVAFGIGTFRWPIEGNRLDADEQMERILTGGASGCPRTVEALLAATHDRDRTRLAAGLERCANGGADLKEEVRVRRPDGMLRHIQIRGCLVPTDGRSRPLVGACADVTELRLMDEDKAALVAVLSHELRTPLNAISGYADLLLEGIPTPLPPRQADYARRIQASCRHVGELTEALLTHAKATAGKLEYHIQAVTVGAVLDEIEPLTAPQRAARELDYDDSRCERAMVLKADPRKVEQILLNLVANAIKFTPPRGRITIGTERAGPGRCALVVRDTGIGMKQDELRLLFEPFTQLRRARGETGEGSGLGLSISRDLARGMGGELTAESPRGGGSLFRLTLPLA